MDYSNVKSFSVRKNGVRISASIRTADQVYEIDINLVDADLRRLENKLGYHQRSGEILEDAGIFSANFEMARCIVRNAQQLWGYERM